MDRQNGLRASSSGANIRQKTIMASTKAQMARHQVRHRINNGNVEIINVAA